MMEQDGKKDKIIEIALKRFSHFGIAKTTMNDIADDLSISKASLYYYFPDKNSLILEVANNILSDELERQMVALQNADNVPEGLMKMIEVRLSFADQFHMMKIQDLQMDFFYKDNRFTELRDKLRERENILIENFLDSAIERGELRELNAEKTAQIINNIIMGVGISELHFCAGPNSLHLSQEIKDAIRKNLENIIQLIYNGIKK